MDLTHDFRLPLPVDEAWALLSDLERVARGWPGATLGTIEGETVTGQLLVKVGPVSVRYEGTVTLAATDREAGTAVLEATGDEVRGDGAATASVRLALTPDGAGTHVHAATTLEVSGRIARFGRAVIVDVGDRMVAQAVDGFGGEMADPLATAAVAGSWEDEEDPAEAAPVETEEVEVDEESEAEETESERVDPVAEADPLEVEVIETELGDPFDAITPDADDVDPTPTPVPAVRPVDAGTSAPATAVAPTSSLATKVGPVVAGIALLWVLKKLLSRSKP